jgi:hypothetical protein
MATAFKQAAWIWRQSEAGKDEFSDFVTTFSADKADGKAYTLSIAADSNYTVWLNGELAAFGQYADYPDYKVYDRVDVTSYVRDGENRLVITVWYYGVDSSTYTCGEAGVIFELCEDERVLACSSEKTLSRLSRDYVSGKENYISSQLGLTYHYDMRGYDGYIESDSGCEGFEPSRIVPTISTDFHLRPNRKLALSDRLSARVCNMGMFKYVNETGNPARDMQYADLSHRFAWDAMATGNRDMSVPPHLVMADGDVERYDGIYFIVDLGEENAGFLDFDLEVPRDCRIDIGYGEHLQDGRCRTSIRGFFCDIEAKVGRNTYLHTFRRFGCRYIQFFVHAHEVTVHYAGLRPTPYPLTFKKFQSGNLLRDTIYHTCQRTLALCLHEHYEDTPWREQALYVMDSRNQMLCGYYAFGETRAARASLELISHGIRDDGLLSLCYPAGTDYPIPSFSCMYFVQMNEYIRYTGDRTLAEAHYADLEHILHTAFLSRMQPEGVIENFYGVDACPPKFFGYWNFYEWTETMGGAFPIEHNGKRLEAPLNAFLSLALQAMAEIADTLGRSEDAARYRETAKSVNDAIVKNFYNPETKLFESFDRAYRGQYATLTQALCTLCGAADGVDKSHILRVLATNGKDTCGYTVYPNTLSMNAFRFDALLAIDRDRYAPVILDEIDRDYFYMLRQGATSFWETIVGAADFDDAGSLCHGWSALPIYYYETLM